MKLLDKLERKYSKFAIRNLMLYIIFANGAVFLMNLLSGYSLTRLLVLDPARVMSGEIWRLITFVMIPPTRSIIFVFFILYFYYMIGETLEHQWGDFKFNVYYFLGMFLNFAAAMLLYFITGMSYGVSAIYLNLTLFFAFATLFPDFTVRLYLILPIKIKYLAYLSAAFMVFNLFVGSIGTKISILAGLGNYLLFFGKDLIHRPKHKINTAARKQQYTQKVKADKPYRHKCHKCGITDVDDPRMEFRYCSQCEGHFEYCMNHIKDHEHN